MRFRCQQVVMAALTAALLAPPAATAQIIVQESGARAGLLFANLSFDGADPDAPPTSRRVGFSGGVFAVRDLRNRLSIQAEGLISVKGAEFETSHLRITYLEFPTLLRYTFDLDAFRANPVHVVTGPALAVKIDAGRSAGAQSSGAGDEVAAIDLGWVVGAGIDLDGILMDVRYTWGLVDVLQDVQTGSGRASNSTFAVMVGLRIPRS